jgi:hypothetical protein
MEMISGAVSLHVVFLHLISAQSTAILSFMLTGFSIAAFDILFNRWNTTT